LINARTSGSRTKRMKRTLLLLLAVTRLMAQNPPPDFDRATAFAKPLENKVYHANFTVNWLPDGKRF
jgi:hypothetical protein